MGEKLVERGGSRPHNPLRLVLVDATLYKIEAAFPKEKEAEIGEHLFWFLDSFKPNMATNPVGEMHLLIRLNVADGTAISLMTLLAGSVFNNKTDYKG